MGSRVESRTTFQLAIRAASGELDDHDRAIALIQIAASQAEAGFVDDAIRTANSLTDDRTRDILGEGRSRLEALAKIATARVKAGDVAGALRAADMIDGEDLKAPLLVDIATAQVAAGDLRGARGWVERIGSPTAKSRALLGITRGMAKRKQAEGPSKP